MSTIISIANELQALQGRITADKALLMEARAKLELEYKEMIGEWEREHYDRCTNASHRHARLMSFIDGQIAAKDEALEGELKQAAE